MPCTPPECRPETTEIHRRRRPGHGPSNIGLRARPMWTESRHWRSATRRVPSPAVSTGCLTSRARAADTRTRAAPRSTTTTGHEKPDTAGAYTPYNARTRRDPEQLTIIRLDGARRRYSFVRRDETNFLTPYSPPFERGLFAGVVFGRVGNQGKPCRLPE